jgi:hypothetical protein
MLRRFNLKKTGYFIVIIALIFAFVSCSQNNSQSNNSNSLVSSNSNVNSTPSNSNINTTGGSSMTSDDTNSSETGTDGYQTINNKGLYEYDGVTNIERIFEPNQFPADPTFGFANKKISGKDIGLKTNEAYLIPQSDGVPISQWIGMYDEIQLVNAMEGLLNRNVPLMYTDNSNFTTHGGDDAVFLKYYQNERGYKLVKFDYWYQLLEKVKSAYNGIIIFEDIAENNSNASFLMYNLANINVCLPVQRKIYDRYMEYFKDMEIVAYFKSGVGNLKALNYMTKVLLPKTNVDNAYCPSVQVDGSNTDGSEYAQYDKLTKVEAMLGLDLAFAKKMFIFNIPTYEYLPTYKYFDRIMRHLKKPAVIWGWVASGSEAAYSNWGHCLTEGTMTKNGSFHAVVPVKNTTLFPYKNPKSTVQTPKNKVYLSFSGESLDASMFFFNTTVSAYNSSSRGKVKMNWGWAGAIADMYPAMAEYLITRATPNDCFYNFIGYSYTHFEAMVPNEILKFGAKTQLAASKIFDHSPVQHLLANMGSQRYPYIFNSMAKSSLLFFTNADVPASMYPYGYLKAYNEKQKYMSRASGYAWQLTGDLTVGGEKGNSTRLDIAKTVNYLEQLYKAECDGQKPFIYTFWTQHKPYTIEDYVALTNALDKSKFEVVDFTTLSEIASKIPKSQLDQYENDKIVNRDNALVGKVTAIPQTNTFNTNYIDLFEQSNKNNVRIDKTLDGIKVKLLAKNNVGWQGNQGTYTISQTTLPKGARYCVMDIESMSNGATNWMFWMNGKFGMNAQDDIVLLSGTSLDAQNTRSGRVVISISPEVYSYTDKGYPVSITGCLYGKNSGSEVKITSVKFVSELPKMCYTLRVNGSMGKMTKIPLVIKGIPYYDATDIMKSLGFNTSISDNILTVTAGSMKYSIDFLKGNIIIDNKKTNIGGLKSENGLYISPFAIKAILPYDIYFDEDRLELAINQ